MDVAAYRIVQEALTNSARHSAGAPPPSTSVTLVATGLSNAEIAGQWHVSESTVKTHVSRAMMKLAARDRAQLVVLAYQSGPARAGW